MTEQEEFEFRLRLEQENAAPAQIPQSASIRAPAPVTPPSFLTQLGRSAASLMDIPIEAVAGGLGQVAYPFARVGRSPQQAQALVESSITGPLSNVIGRMTGVSQTPEYQGEAARRALGFVGGQVQSKVVAPVAAATGASEADVANMLGTLATAVPKVAAPPAARAAQVAREKVLPGIVKAAEEVPIVGPGIRAAREAGIREDLARGAEIDARLTARRLGVVLPQDDTASGRTLTMASGAKGREALVAENKRRVRELQLAEMGLPLDTPLHGKGQAFDLARERVAGPYNEIAALPKMQADQPILDQLANIRRQDALIGTKDYAKTINDIVDEAVNLVNEGATGAQLLDNIKSLRADARKVHSNPSADLPAQHAADARLATANALETMVERNVGDPKLLARFRNARTKMARSYAYEAATDYNTGVLDPAKLARVTRADNNLTGSIAELGQVAGNFPEAFSGKPISRLDKGFALGRTGLAGTLGGVAGYYGLGGGEGAAIGSILGSTAGHLGQSWAARRLASPSYQLTTPILDRRPRGLLGEVGPTYGPEKPQLLLGYEPTTTPVEFQGYTNYQPNFTIPQRGPAAKFVGPEPTRQPLLSAPSAESTMGALRAEDIRQQRMAAMTDAQRALANQREAALRRQAEAQALAAEEAARKPTPAGVLLELAPSGALREAAPARGAGGVYAGEPPLVKGTFNVPAEQMVAFNKIRGDLSQVVPGMRTLTDKALAEKMLDRQWVQDAVTKAQEKAAAFEELAVRAKSAKDRAAAQANRQKMMDLAEELDQQLRRPRPVEYGGQGPKTRAAQRGLLGTLGE